MKNEKCKINNAKSKSSSPLLVFFATLMVSRSSITQERTLLLHSILGVLHFAFDLDLYVLNSKLKH